MILFPVTTGRPAEFDWLFRGGVAVLFPEQWDRLRTAAPLAESDRDVVDAYHRMLFDSAPWAHSGGPPTNGACGSRRRPPGHPLQDCRRGFGSTDLRLHSRAW